LCAVLLGYLPVSTIFCFDVSPISIGIGVINSSIKSPISLCKTGFIYKINPDSENSYEEFYTDHLIISIRPIPKSRIEDVFSSYSPIESGRIYERKKLEKYSKSKSITQSHSQVERWHFISGIESEKLFREKINKVFNEELSK